MANLKLGVTIGGNVAIHAGNYNNYAPTLTGGNASGTWNINVTGSAATLTTARTITIGNTGKTFNGSANLTWTLAEIGAQPAGSYLTSYTETDTLATVTSRGNTTTGAINVQGTLEFDTYLFGDGKYVINVGDSWLRLNQNGDFGSGVYTPYILRNDGLLINYGGGRLYNGLIVEGETKLGSGAFKASTDQSFGSYGNYTFRDAVSIWNPNGTSAPNTTTVMSIGSMSNGISLVASGRIDASGGNSSNWNTAYDNSITAVAVSGGPTKTLTLTQQDGGTLTATWSDVDTDTDTNTYLTSASFNTTNGVLTLTRNDSVTVTVDLDGRFYTQSESDGRYVNVTGDVMTGALGISTGTAGIDSFYVDGTYGRLFTVTDDLSDAVFSVNTISGLPIIEAYSDYSVRMGRYGQNDFYINPSGNTGFGTASPAYKVDVTGSLRVSANIYVGGYIEPDGQSMNLRKVNAISFAPNNTWNDPYVHGIMSTDINSGNSDNVSINSYNDITLRLDANNNNSESYLRITNNTQGNNTIAYIGYDGSTNVAWFGGVATAANDFRAPIFYDSADTNYYVDPNSNSRLNVVRAYKFENNDGVSTNSTFGIYFGNGDGTPYAIYRTAGAWTSPFPDLRIAFHTGIQIGASTSYGGTRFYSDYDMATELFSVGNGDVHVRVANNLYMGGNLVATQTWVQAQGYLTSVSDVWVNTSGDTMTGNLAFGATSNLGITWGLNTDAAFIKFISSGNQAGGSYLEIGTQDDLDEEIKFTQSGTVRFYLATDGFLKTGGGAKYVYESGTWGISISGNSATTSQTEFGSLTIGGRPVATQDFVTSQGYLTSYTETSTLAQVTSRGNVATGDIYVPSSAKFRARYDSTNNYHASLDWYGLQLGNNGANYIIAGRTNAGGKLVFYTNNTSDFTSINGSYAATMHASGRTSFGTDADNGYQVQVYGSLYASDWIRVGGSQGLYFESYGGGFRMTDSTWVRIYNDKNLYTAGTIQAARFEDANDSNYYGDFASTSRFKRLFVQQPDANSAAGPALRVSKGYDNLVPDILYDTVVIESNDVTSIRMKEADGGTAGWSTGDGYTSFTANTPMRFYTAGSTNSYIYSGMGGTLAMYIDQSQRIGMGTAAPTSRLHVVGNTNGADVFAVDGINGRLFTVSDDLSDSLFSVNTIAGLPLIEAFADNTIKIGKYGSNSITISNSKIAINSDTVDANFPFYVSDRSTAASRYILTNPGMGFNLADNYAQLQLYGPSGAYIDFVNSGGDYNGRIIWSSGAFAVTGNMSWGGATLSGAVWNGTAISDSYISSASNWNTAYNKRPTAVSFSGTSTKTLTLTLGDGSTLTAAFNDIDTDTNTDGQTLSISGSTLTISGGNSVTLPSGGISQATADGLYVSQTNNTSLNTDSRNTRGVTRLYRYDDNSDYSVQHYWTGSYWYLRGFSGDTYHAGVQVAYANDAGNADTTDGLHVHSGRNNEANKIVRTDGNGYIQAGWINSDSGNMGFGNRIARIQCSDDNYIRFQTLTEFKVSLGLSGRNEYSRRIDYSSDSRYHVGSFGHGGISSETAFHYGSGFFDVWSVPSGALPSGMSHIHGINMLHYTAGDGGEAYGWQLAGQYNKPGEYWARNNSGGTFSAWYQFITSANIGSQSVSYATTAGSLSSMNISQFTNNSGYLTSETIGTGNTSGVAGAKYQINDTWLRVNSDNRQYQVYGNSRTIIWRTDGNTNDHGGGGYAYIWYYGGSSDGARIMISNTNGDLWTNSYGWLHDYFQRASSAITTSNIGSQSVSYASSAGSATNVVTIQDAAPGGSAGKLWWESDTGKLKVYYNSAWVDASPIPDMNIYYPKAGGSITGDVVITQTLTVVGNTLVQGTFTETSDISLKENIVPLTGSLDKVLKLNGVSFNKKETPELTEIGFIAQEVEEVIPELVSEMQDGIKTVSYSRVAAVLVETIKEQQAQIEELKDLVAQLSKKLDNL